MAATIDCHLDWVRYTAPWIDGHDKEYNLNRARWVGELFEFTGEMIDIGQGYNQGLKMNAGAVLWHDTRPEQGISVQLSGMDLQEIRQVGLLESDLLAFILSIKGHCSTLHAALNVHDSKGQVSEIIAEHERGTLATRARNVGVYSSKTKINGSWQSGDTFYIGSSKSQVQIRVYNKAAEQGIAGDWIRIEIVWRGKYAQGAHRSMVSDGIEAVTRGAIGHQVQPTAQWWKDAMIGETVEPTPIERKESDRARWLREVVAPALLAQIKEEKSIGESATEHLFINILKMAQG